MEYVRTYVLPKEEQLTVEADIQYLDGTLAGLEIPSGFRVYFDDQRQAQRCANWLERVRREGDFVRDAGTGNRYTVRRVHTSW